MGKPQFSKNFLFNLGFGTLLALATVVITLIYTGQEHNLHWWIDWYNRTLEVVEAWENSPEAAWQIIAESLAGDRNRLYTIPLVPFLLIAGKSRAVYQIALALAYLFPFNLVMGSLAAQLVPRWKHKYFWLAALITLLTPVIWMSTFLGIPDTGAAAFMGVATLLYLQIIEIDAKKEVDIKKEVDAKKSGLGHWVYRRFLILLPYWRVPAVGVAIAMAIMIRRHFAYGGMALLGAIGILALIDFGLFIRKSLLIRNNLRNNFAKTWLLAFWKLIINGLQIFIMVDTCIFTLKKVVPEFTSQAMATNYRNLYTSWSLPFLTISQHYLELLGIIPWLLVATGYTINYFHRKQDYKYHKKTNLIVFSGLISLGIWLLKLRYGNVFYFLHVTPLVVMGIALLMVNIHRNFSSKWRTFLLSIIMSFFAINLAIGFTDTGKLYHNFRSLFALGIPPIVRHDYDEVARLIKYLRAIAPHQEPIYVVGHQRLHLSPSLINSGEMFLYGNKNQLLKILSTAQADSQDHYPLEQLLQAEIVVLPSNLGEYLGEFANFPANGEWLPPGEYDVAKVVFYAFIQNWLITEDFKELPMQFQFQGNTTVKIYERTRPTSIENTIKTLVAMQAEIKELPGSQLPWMSLSNWLNSTTILSEANNSYTLVAFPTEDPQPWVRSFLYLFPPTKNIKITGNVNFYHSFCQDLSFGFKLFDYQGKLISSTRNQGFTKNSSWEFSLNNPLEKTYLVLETQPRTKNGKLAHSCGFWLSGVKISK